MVVLCSGRLGWQRSRLGRVMFGRRRSQVSRTCNRSVEQARGRQEDGNEITRGMARAVGDDGDAKGWMACMQNEVGDGGMEPCQWFWWHRPSIAGALRARVWSLQGPQPVKLAAAGALRHFHRVCSLIKLDLGPWQLALGGQEIVQTFQASATEPHRARHLKSHGWEPIGTARDASCNASATAAHTRPFIVLPMQSALQQTARGRVIFLRGLPRAKKQVFIRPGPRSSSIANWLCCIGQYRCRKSCGN